MNPLRFLPVAAALLPSFAFSQIAVSLVSSEVDGSNQSGWWSPVTSYVGSNEYNYLVYNSTGTTPETHQVTLTRVDNAGTLTHKICGGTSPAGFVDDPGHRVPSVARDGSGRLHVFAGMHNEEWIYFRTDGTTSGALVNCTAEMPPEDLALHTKFTYPVLATAPNGDVYMIARANSSVLKSGRLYRWSNAAQVWTLLDVFARELDRAVYPEDLQVDFSGVVHILYSWAGFPTSDLRHQLSYLKYSPGNQSFLRANGTPVAAPLTTATSEVIQPIEDGEFYAPGGETGGKGLQTAKMTITGTNSVPMVAYRYRSSTETDAVYGVKYATFASNQWQCETVYSGTTQTHATIDITDAGGTGRIYYVLRGGANNNVKVAVYSGTNGWVATDLLQPNTNITASRIAVVRNKNGIDVIYLVDAANRKLYLGKNP